MAKFKVGDKAVSHSDDYGITKTGWTGIVTEITGDHWMQVRGKNRIGELSTFDVKINDFDLVSDDQKIVITTDGKTTTAAFYEGKKIVKKAKARCNPDDTFDFVIGAELAFDRLTDRDTKRQPRDLRELMTTGTFGKSKRFGEFVIVGNTMVFKTGGWMPITDYSIDDLKTRAGDMIEYLVRPSVTSFNIAAMEYSANNNVVWKRK